MKEEKLIKLLFCLLGLLLRFRLPCSYLGKATLIALESPALAQYTLVPLNMTVQTVDPLN